MTHVRTILAAMLLALWTAAAPAQTINKDNLRTSPKVAQAFRSVVAKPSEAVVRVLCDGKEAALGAIIAADGWILTKASELKGKVTCKTKDGKEIEAKIVGIDVPFDLAMLKIDAKSLPTIQWGDSKDAKVGSWVASVGPGADPIAIGVVSVGPRKYKAGDQPPKMDLSKSGYLGVQLEEADGGAKITGVFKSSPAREAGFKINDIVYEAAGKKIIDSESFINTIQRHKPGDVVVFKIKRGEEDVECKATLTKRPRDLQGNPQETMGSKLSSRRGGFPVILQHDTVLKPNDCGGPLVDLDGKTIGINISRAGRTESYAIPADDIRPLLNDLKSGKLAPREEDPK